MVKKIVEDLFLLDEKGYDKVKSLPKMYTQRNKCALLCSFYVLGFFFFPQKSTLPLRFDPRLLLTFYFENKPSPNFPGCLELLP